MPEASIADELARGIEHHRAGHLRDAGDHYRRVLAAVPGHPDALHLLGVLEHQAGRHAEALALIDRATAVQPNHADYHNHAGLALLALGRADAAAARFGRAIRLNPDYAGAYNNLGTALQHLDRSDEAIASFREALRLRPDDAATNLNLGNVLVELGHCDDALACHLRARALEDTPQFRLAFALALRGASFAEPATVASDPALWRLAARAIREAWMRPADLSAACVRLLATRPPIRDAVARAAQTWPRRLEPEALCGDAGLAVLAREPLLLALLENTPIADAGLERVLTSVRCTFLERARDDSADEMPGAVGGDAHDASEVALGCALARQCFINDYVFDAGAIERAHALELARALSLRLHGGAVAPASWIAAVAMYLPLESVDAADRLVDGIDQGDAGHDTAVAALVHQQVVDPRCERTLRLTLPRLTAIDPASSLVRTQYEEHPYPKWVCLPRPAASPRVGGTDGPQAPEILVAGCGTGQESIEVALEYPVARVLAIDLSLSSLAYASRKAQEMVVANVEHAHADILHLATLGRSFDAIYAVGVLHHLADPEQGLRILVSLLRSGGSMLVGLYSAAARRDIVEARAYIAAAGYGRSADDIRRCRQDLMVQSPDSPLGRIARLRDFHTTTECRDLLFHVEEHRFTLPEVGELLARAGLRVTAFGLSPGIRREYARRYPDDRAMTDLAHWHAFEQEHPDIFAGMYVFWVRRNSERG